MYLKNIFLAACASLALNATAQQINPITQAVLNSYETLLEQNPNDYETLYQRGAQYYNLGMLEKAFSDIEKAISLTPEKDKETRKQEFALMASICYSIENYNLALTAIDNALAIAPSSYPYLYTRGNICLKLKNADEAEKSFKAMQSIKSRSQESLFGLAKTAILKGDVTAAKELMKEAEGLDSSNYLTYCRLGDINRELGENQLAAADYLNAFALGGEQNSRPIQSLVELASDDYNAVESALNYAISKTSNTLPLNFMKGNIALQSGNYAPAYTALSDLLSSESGREAGVYAAFAKACIGLDKPEEAIKAITIAVNMNPSAEYQLEKARIERSTGNPATALIDAGNAYKSDINNIEALIEMALDNMALNQYEPALENLNEAVLTDPTNMEVLMLRAFTYDKLKNSRAALADYSRVAKMNSSDFRSSMYKAFATALTGNKPAGDLLMAETMKNAKNPGQYFDAAIYYTQTGNLEKGKELINKAKAEGFQNLFLLNKDNTANLNIAPLRNIM